MDELQDSHVEALMKAVMAKRTCPKLLSEHRQIISFLRSSILLTMSVDTENFLSPSVDLWWLKPRNVIKYSRLCSKQL